MASYTLSRRTLRLLQSVERVADRSDTDEYDTDESRGLALVELAGNLYEEFLSSRNPAVLELAATHSTDAAYLLPHYHPDSFLAYGYLSLCLWRRSQDISGSRADLQMAVYCAIRSMVACCPGHSKRIYAFCALGNALSFRFIRYGDRLDLEYSVMYFREVLMLCPVDHPEIDTALSGLASALRYRYHQYGNGKDLETGISLYVLTLTKCPPSHHQHRATLFNLVAALITRFEHGGDLADLDSAIAYGQELLRLCPAGHYYRSFALCSLAPCFRHQFYRNGDPADLDSWFTYSSEALSLRPVGHPRRWESLHVMANYFWTRHDLYGIPSDIDAAIEYWKEQLVLTTPGDHHRLTSLNGVGSSFLDRFAENGNEEDLRAAIEYLQENIIMCIPGNPARCFPLHNLARCFRSRFELHSDVADLHSAIAHFEEVLGTAVAYGLPVAAELASTLLGRFQVLHEVRDLDLSFVYLHRANDHTPLGDPERLMVYKYFASAYIAQHSLDHDPAHRQHAFTYFEQAAFYLPGGLKARLQVSLEWIGTAHAGEHPSELKAYKASLTILDQYFTVTPHLASRHEIRKRKVPPSLAADAASCAILSGQLEVAVELLEYGRALLWTQLTRIRTPLDALCDRDENGKRLADEFARLSRQLEMKNISTATQTDSAELDPQGGYAALVRQWDTVVEQIRKVDGFANFLSPPPFVELQKAAAEGPVIILNIGVFHSDTLIVTKDGSPRLVPLHLNIQEVYDMVDQFRDIFRMYTGRGEEQQRGGHLLPMLRRLWQAAVLPVVRELKNLVPRGSRIWWCPTSNLASLPLHAAGPYEDGRANLSDIFVSSYTPTLSALIRARRDHASPRSLLAIGQPIPYEGFGEGNLVTVEKELETIESLCPPSLPFHRLYGPDATADAAMEGLKTHDWIHLACHGKQDADDPYESCFAMGDKPLRLIDIMQTELSHSQFAFLSACHTAVGDVHAPDEMIHLAAGLQFSGFKSVVGTIGAVDDGVVVNVVQEFYRNIFRQGGRCTDVARALSKTMKTLKRLPLDQKVIFVHIGA